MSYSRARKRCARRCQTVSQSNTPPTTADMPTRSHTCSQARTYHTRGSVWPGVRFTEQVCAPLGSVRAGASSGSAHSFCRSTSHSSGGRWPGGGGTCAQRCDYDPIATCDGAQRRLTGLLSWRTERQSVLESFRFKAF